MAKNEHNPGQRRQAERLSGARETAKTRETARRQISPSELLAAFLAFVASLPERAWHAARRAVCRAHALLHEHRTGGFPESDRRAVQLILLLVGMAPMCRSLLRERLFHRRRQSLTAAAVTTAAPAAHHNRRRPLAFVGVALLFACVAAFFSIYTPATTVFYKGKALETVRDGVAAQRVAAQVENFTAETLGAAFVLEDDAIEYTSGLARRSELGELDELKRELTDQIGLVTYGYTLYIDGERIGSTQYEGALEALIDQIKAIGESEDTLSVDFVEDVRIEQGYIPTDSLTNLGQIAEVINSTKEGEETYTVVKGDTWSEIAQEHDMSIAELEALNPGYNIDWINIGDELILSREVPYLTVKVTERQNYVDDVNYDIIYVDDSSMYQGDTRVIEKGEYGSADIVADVVYINGVESERTVISQVMLTAPKTETRARGTKERPNWLPTGNFRWPCSGRITSYFGYRNTGIRGATTYHQGIDIACSYGTAIAAADGGTVEYTGYKGAMGYTVIINHGNGYKTYYEHCSSFAVRSGAHVYKGQVIAYVGSSGVSSGAHCHFGVMKNGSYVNPLSYLS